MGSKITADSDCSHEIKRLLVSWKESCGKLSILKSRDITLPTKVCIVKTMIFPVVMYGCEMMLIVLSCVLTFCDSMDCSPPGSSVHGIFQSRILEWVTIFLLQGIFLTRDRIYISCVSYWQADSLPLHHPGSCSPRDSQKSSPAPQFKGG